MKSYTSPKSRGLPLHVGVAKVGDKRRHAEKKKRRNPGGRERDI
jgi:hypothetical protein